MDKLKHRKHKKTDIENIIHIIPQHQYNKNMFLFQFKLKTISKHTTLIFSFLIYHVCHLCHVSLSLLYV